MSASTATGSLIFLPVFAWLAQNGGWRPVVTMVLETAWIAGVVLVVVKFAT